MQGLSRDLHAERLGRIGDIEVLVDLVAGAAEAQERRVAALEAQVRELTTAIGELTPVVANVSEKLDRRVRISVQTEPGAAAVRPTRTPDASGTVRHGPVRRVRRSGRGMRSRGQATVELLGPAGCGRGRCCSALAPQPRPASPA